MSEEGAITLGLAVMNMVQVVALAWIAREQGKSSKERRRRQDEENGTNT